MVTGHAATSDKRPKGRSPSYPAVGLETAIRRARQLYDKQRQHPVPVEALARYWGYKSLNGPAALTLAALRKFGLLLYEGSGEDRRARLTDLAVSILANPDVDARTRAIQEAALNPPIHQEVWAKFGSELPPDDTLEWELTRERGFTETGAREFIPNFRDTIEYAQLGASSYTRPQDVSRVEVQEAVQVNHQDDDYEPSPLHQQVTSCRWRAAHRSS
jgi:hypothetical protein